MKKLLSLLCMFIFPACATIVDGRSQEILVNTNPSGANCDVLRNGNKIATVTDTPASFTIEKTKYDITINCKKKGYEQSSYINHSGTAGATFGNIVAGGLIGWGVDSVNGSDNKYDSPVNITLNKK